MAGFTTLTFDYAYTASGRKAPDRLPKLMEVHTAAALRLARECEAVLLAGKSMGGRVGGHVAGEGLFPAAGVVYLGYPLVAMGKSDPRDTSHLLHIDAPQLFISGTRDPMGPNDLVAAVAASVPAGTFVPIESGDHSLVPLKKSDRTLDEALDEATDVIAVWHAAN
jgi:predicted alpha/beta-hydrolase family hydrolase